MNGRGVQLDPLAAYYAALTHEELVARCIAKDARIKTTSDALTAADVYIKALERRIDLNKARI